MYNIEISEIIPNNAQIYIFSDLRVWVPKADFVDRLLKTDSQKSSHWDSIKVIARYVDTKPNGKFEGYEPASGLIKKNFNPLNGYQGSLLLSILFNKDRWNKDGSWNW